MSLGSDKNKSSSVRIVVSGLPQGFDREKLESLLSAHGNFQIIEVKDDGNSSMATVQYQSKDEADKAVTALTDKSFEGSTLQARHSERKSPRRTLGPNNANSQQQQQRAIDFPLRILVQSEMVGAIIGRGGQTIRQITQQTRARVDVHRKDNVGSVEKAITIYGQPENCTNACQQILKVMQEEAKNTGKTEEMPLKILAHNNLIGRIIGKQGATIKRIMEDTDTKITVSSINEINSFNMERVITIRGGIEEMSKAEAEISSKLRSAFESDVQAMVPHSVMFPGLHPTAMMSTAGMNMGFHHGGNANGPARPNPVIQHGNNLPNYGHSNYNGIGGPNQGGLQGVGGIGGGNVKPAAPPFAMAHHGGGVLGSAPMVAAAVAAAQCQGTTYVYIPNTAVGAIIGTKGSHIRNIIKFSGASVKIAPAADENIAGKTSPSWGGQNSSTSNERKITIYGSPESQWKAQYLIYEKLRGGGFSNGMDIRLTIEIMVPTSQVGRIIGKGGANVRELQRLTNGMIKLPEQGTSTGEETPVHINGTFYSVQSAQRRLRAMVQSALMTAPTNGNGPMRGNIGHHGDSSI